MNDYVPGAQVELSDGRTGTVRFCGQIEGKVGDFVGVELDEKTGKNDGTVQGKRYFDCRDGYGIFIRPATVFVTAPPPAAARKPARPNSFKPGPARVSTASDSTLNKRKSLNAPSPSPGPKTSRPSSIVRSPTKQLGGPPSASASRTSTPSTSRVSSTGPGAKPRLSTAGARTSMGPPAAPVSRTARQPSVSSANPRTSTGITRPASGRVAATAPRTGSRTDLSRRPSADSQVNSGDDKAGVKSPTKEILSPQPKSPMVARANKLEKIAAASTTPSSTPPSAPVAKRSAAASGTAAGSRAAGSTVLSRENDDLRAKVKVLERKRIEDRDRVKQLDKVQQERDKFEGIIHKLQQKYAPLQQENTELRKEIKEAEARFDSIESMQAEHDTVLELATLDREMAQEESETARAELDEARQRLEELELEVELLRDENQEITNGLSPEEKSSANWFQMERSNERYREALIKLRDLSQETERDLRQQIESLEEDAKDLGITKEELETTKEKLAHSEAAVEDLRQQLDNALGAEDMIEDLTERNMSMNERIEELNAVISELEDLREINDELEANHVQNEREMQEELDFKDTVISEQARLNAAQEAAIEDREYSLSRFRELAKTLSSELEDMRASQAVTEGESEKLNDHSRAMMDLNMKLQLSAAKTQVKTIDLELRRLQAEEAEQHLQVVKLFLPDSYSEDKDSVLALLRFRRLAFKANLLNGFLRERVNSQPHPGHEDDIFVGCDAVDKLVWVSAMCDRFVNDISHCSMEQFGKYQDALHELEPVERALNYWIDGLRRDDLKEKQCAEELQRTIALMSHLGEVHISNDLPGFANDIHMRATMMQTHLESTTTIFIALRTMVRRVIPEAEEGDELAVHFAKKCDLVITQTRSTKVVAGKVVRALDDLKTRSLSLMPDTGETFEQAEDRTQKLAGLARGIAGKLHELFTQDEGRVEPFTHAEVQNVITGAVLEATAANESDLFSEFMTQLRGVNGQLSDLAALAMDLNQTQEFDATPEPWKLRSQELKALKTVPIDAEEELRRLKEEHGEARRTIAQRDEHLSTAVLKIETLEARMRDAQANIDRISNLQAQLEAAGHQTASLKEDIEKQDRELKTLEADRDKWKSVASESRLHAGALEADGTKAGKERAVATAREMDALKKDVESLQAAVRHLREDNRRARLTEQPNHDWLAEPLRKPASLAQQRKDIVVAEGKDVLGELLRAATSATVFDLATLPKDKLAWKPARTTPQYHAARQREGYATLRAWQGEVVKKTELLTAGRTTGETARRTMRDPAARLQIRLPGANGKALGGDGAGVEVVGSREWEALQGRIGAV